MYEKLDRISTVDGQFATIKYVGTLPNKIWGPNVMALGVEWDQPERGRNNGTLDGVSYFETEFDRAGSFIKLNNKKIVRKRYDFIEALIKQYTNGDVASEAKVIFGTKVAESYGFEKLNEIQSNFNNLVSISLEKKNIHTSFNKFEEVHGIFNNLDNITSLDLSYNLFNDLNNVWEIINQLNNLTELNLNGNRFFNAIEGITGKPHETLCSLKLASTNIKIEQVIHLILPKFPNLQDITLSGNRYNDDNFTDVSIKHESLLNIDLSFNRLQTIPHLKNKSNVVRCINLADNCISNMYKGITFNNIHCIDLRNNEIDTWNTIDNLYLSFPELTELRINGNPLFYNMSVEEMTINLIARFECEGTRDTKSGYKVGKLNGSSILNDEITNAELYFISKVKNGDYNYDRRNKRWQLLMEKYSLDNSDVLRSEENKNKLSLKKIKLKICFEVDHQTIGRVFLIDNTILRLKGIISKYLNRSVLQFRVFYYINDSDNETGNKVRQVLDDNIATISNFGFLDGQKLYVTLNT